MPNRKAFSLPSRICSSFRDATKKTSCAASSTDASGTPNRLAERHTKS
jgi:hypothetical protein